MNSFLSRLAVFLFFFSVLVSPAACFAGDLDKKIEDMVKDFEPQVGEVQSGEERFVVVRSFLDRHSGKPSKRSEEITDLFYNSILDRYLGKSDIVILTWRSEVLFEVRDAVSGGDVYYELGAWGKNLSANYGRGFLITGTSGVNEELLEINAELVDVLTGKVLIRSKASLPKGADDIVYAKAPAPAPQPAADGDARTGESARAPAGAAVVEQAAPSPAATSAALVEPAAPERPTQSAEAPEVVLKDLDFKTVQGVNYRYEGYLKDGRKHGRGTMYFDSGDRYEGEWQNDRKHGRGSYFYADGDRYEGEWRADNMHGRGVYFFKSGNRYEGSWQGDKKHGPGVYYFKNGDRWEGAYSNDKKHGRSVYKWANGGSVQEIWKDGKLVK